jgi:hypothetical protein
MKQGTQVSEVFDTFLDSFVQQHSLSVHQQKVIAAVTTCRTAAQGGHVDACNSCGAIRISYNSCRNRHCPKCGGIKKEEWIEARRSELLPIHYYHIVFTVPHQLNAWMRYNEQPLYNLLFESGWETVAAFAADPKYLGATSGMIAILHTWGQQLSYHPHLHCIVAGGAITRHQNWKMPKRTSGKFLFPVKAMSKVYRAKLLTKLSEFIGSKNGRLLQTPANSMTLPSVIKSLYRKDWVVYAKRPFGGPAQVVEYLGRYTHKVAISNQRLVGIENGRVYFNYTDYRFGGSSKQMSLSGEEFIRRWLQHVLPFRFVKIRHYGFLSNRDKNKKLQHIAGQIDYQLMPPLLTLDCKQRLRLLLGLDLERCPHCSEGRMVTVKTWERSRSP